MRLLFLEMMTPSASRVLCGTKIETSDLSRENGPEINPIFTATCEKDSHNIHDLKKSSPAMKECTQVARSEKQFFSKSLFI